MEELFAIIGLFTLPLSIAFAVAWWNARKELQLRREIQLEYGVRQHVTTENQRLERTVDALALEVERLAEGQRFVAKVLSERSSAERGRERPNAAPSLPPSPHVITPH